MINKKNILQKSLKGCNFLYREYKSFIEIDFRGIFNKENLILIKKNILLNKEFDSVCFSGNNKDKSSGSCITFFSS